MTDRYSIETTHDGKFRVVELFPNGSGFLVIGVYSTRMEAANRIKAELANTD